MLTRPTRLTRRDVFRETEKSYHFRLPVDGSANEVDVYVPKSQAEWRGIELRIAPWLGHAVREKQGVLL